MSSVDLVTPAGRRLPARHKEASLVRSARFATALATAAFALLTGSASAQVTPAAGYTPPDDTPAIRVGMTLFTNYSYQTEPKITDADGNTVSKNSFDVGRAYLNITGQVSHIVAFRVTPDITRESGLLTL